MNGSGKNTKQFWVESVYRGFRKRRGIETFLRHSCEMSAMLHMCPERALKWKRRRCIVEHHEILLAQQFNQNVVEALYPTYPINNSTEKGWFLNHAFWKEIVEEQNFPLAKVNFPPVIDPIMKNFENCSCVKLLDRLFLDSLPFPNKMDLMMFEQNIVLEGVRHQKGGYEFAGQISTTRTKI